jgi:hypothetical protein
MRTCTAILREPPPPPPPALIRSLTASAGVYPLSGRVPPLCIRWRRVYPLAVAYLFLDNPVDHPSRIYMRTKRSRAHIRLSWLDVLLFPPCLLGSGNTTQASVYLVSAMSHNKIVLTAPSQHQASFYSLQQALCQPWTCFSRKVTLLVLLPHTMTFGRPATPLHR